MKRLRTIDLFCGAGGSSWGAAAAGAHIVAGFDKWEQAGRVYSDNFPEAQFHLDDLREVDPKTLKSQLGVVDLILASPECTNHSPAKGAAPRCEESRRSAFHVVRFAEVFGPRWIVIENVVNMKRWSRYGDLLADLRDLGYNFREQVLNAADFLVPQSRRRLFIVCDREVPPPEVTAVRQVHKNARSVVNLNGLYSFSPLRTAQRAKPTLERAERAISELGRDQDFLIVYYGSDKAGGWQTLDRPLRTITTLDRFAYVRPSLDGHMMRMLQPEELKLAMGWPKKYQMKHGTRRDKIKMIGNAVCPKVMQAVVRTLCECGKES